MADDNVKKIQDMLTNAMTTGSLTRKGETAADIKEHVRILMSNMRGSENEFLNYVEAEEKFHRGLKDKNIPHETLAAAMKERDAVKKILEMKLKKDRTRDVRIKDILFYGKALGVFESAHKKGASPQAESEANLTGTMTNLESRGNALAEVIAPGMSIPQISGKYSGRYNS